MSRCICSGSSSSDKKDKCCVHGVLVGDGFGLEISYVTVPHLAVVMFFFFEQKGRNKVSADWFCDNDRYNPPKERPQHRVDHDDRQALNKQEDRVDELKVPLSCHVVGNSVINTHDPR